MDTQCAVELPHRSRLLELGFIHIRRKANVHGLEWFVPVESNCSNTLPLEPVVNMGSLTNNYLNSRCESAFWRGAPLSTPPNVRTAAPKYGS